jgi:hypothetical protein
MSKLWVLAVAVWICALPCRVEAQPFPFDERFDTYVTGSTIAGQGGWTTWDNSPTANTTVVNTQAFTIPNSLLIAGAGANGADIVHTFTGVTSGLWYAKARVFIPVTNTGETWFILLNTYTAGAPHPIADYGAQVVFCRAGCTTVGVVAGLVRNLGGQVPSTATTPLITGQWMEIRADINLTTNQYQLFYNGVLFDTKPWVTTSPMRFQAFDLFSNAASQSFMDNVWLDTTVPVEGMSFMVE